MAKETPTSGSPVVAKATADNKAAAAKAAADKRAAEDKANKEREALFDLQLATARARRLEKLAKGEKAIAELLEENKALRARVAELEAPAK